MAAGQLTATSTFGALIGDLAANYSLIMSGARNIGGLLPHITQQEVHRDELQITQHPIETGTPVTDHAFPMPYTVEMHVGWSNSTAQTNGFAQAVYAQVLALQATRQPITVQTGKRTYSSMLIKSVGVKTDPDSEFILDVTIMAQQIVITSTSTTTASTTPMSDGSAAVGSAAAGDGTTPGSVTGISGGADPAPSAAVTPDSTGAVTFPNDATQTGTSALTPNASAPSWASLNVGITSTGQISQ